MFNLVMKTLRDKRIFTLGWSLGLLSLGFIMVSFFPSFSGGQIDNLIETLPPALQGLVGNMQDWRELPGYLGSQLFDIRLPIFVSILSIMLAIGLTVSEEDKGQLRTLTALPISRRKIVLAKWLAMMSISFLAALATIIGVEIGLLVIGESVDQLVLVRLGLFTWLLVASLATIIFAVGLSTGKRALTTAIAIILTIGSFLLSTFAQAVDWLERYEPLSFFHYFPAVDIANGTIEWGNVAIYVGCLAVALVATLIIFARRDIKS